MVCMGQYHRKSLYRYFVEVGERADPLLMRT
jgi:hypothetical protein